MTFSHGGTEISCDMVKMDRSKLYGSIQREVLDENGAACRLVTMGSDGKTLIPTGGTAFGYFSPDGAWRDKDDLQPVDLEGADIERVESTLRQVVALDTTVEVDELLGHKIRLAYLLEPGEGSDFPVEVVSALGGGAIYTFPFSYRASFEADQAFVVQAQDGSVWMLVGKPCDIQFIGFEAAVAAEAEEDADTQDEDFIDFGIM